MSEAVSEQLCEEEIFGLINLMIRSFEDNELQQHFPKAVVVGATALVQMLVNNYHNQFQYWGEDDIARALVIIILFFFILHVKCY
jgi:hypothetical protein